MNSNGVITYSTCESTKLGMTYVFAYPDMFGVETMDGLEDWVENDPANRVLEFVPNKSIAIAMSEVYNLK